MKPPGARSAGQHSPWVRWLSLCALVLLAAALRFPRLAQRPMHSDEAVQADKFGSLLEQGRYEYNPEEFHGPALNYLTLPAAKIQGAARYGDVDEVTLRAVTASFGVLLVAASALLVSVLGFAAAAAAALLTAVSPAMVFYSRYYIHETLLVFFSFAALISICRYLRKPGAGWALAAGASLGLMHATKETSILAFVALALAFILNLVFEKWRGEGSPPLPTLVRKRHLLVALVTAVLIASLFYSSFLSHPRGIADSLRAYGNYFELARSNSWHTHPWYYYLSLVLYSHSDGGPVWTEGLILALAVIGFVSALSRKSMHNVDMSMLRFLGFYTLVMVSVYSLIPYKTPWCLLGFLHGMILLAGAGVVRLMQACRRPAAKGLLSLLLVVATAHLGWQAWAGSFRFEADSRNPYVYAHTTKDVFVIVRQVERLARAHPQGFAMPIQVISRENLWPLPWYLRRFPNVRWSNSVSDRTPNAPLILATPDMEPALARKLYELPPPGARELYMTVFAQPVELRPQVELRGYAAKTLWDQYLRHEASSSSYSRQESR